MSEMAESAQPSDDDSAETALGEGSVAPGEAGEAVGAAAPTEAAGQAEVIVGEIPDAHEITKLVWTARCTFPPHGLLGTFPDREQAEEMKREHLLAKHGLRE
jgi:hypothetical protein